MLSTQDRNPVGVLLPVRYIGGSSAGLGKAQCIDNTLRADCLSCFWPGVNGVLSDANGCDPLAELVRALARDSECAIKPGSKPSGGFDVGTLHYHSSLCSLAWFSIFVIQVVQVTLTLRLATISFPMKKIWLKKISFDKKILQENVIPIVRKYVLQLWFWEERLASYHYNELYIYFLNSTHYKRIPWIKLWIFESLVHTDRK